MKLQNKNVKAEQDLIVNNAIKNLDPSFYHMLKAGFKDLSVTEVNICQLFRVGYDSEDIALFTGLSQHGLREKFREIQSKLKVAEIDQLKDFLYKISKDQNKHQH